MTMRIQPYLFVLLLTVFGFMANAQSQAQPKPLRVENITVRVLADAGWNWKAAEEVDNCGIRNADYDCYYIEYSATEEKSALGFGDYEITTGGIRLVYGKTSKNFIDETPVVIIVEGERLSGEKRMYVALQRKEYWDLYNMRPEIKWRLEFDENTEPEFAANIRFD